jgi:hypothetical protein
MTHFNNLEVDSLDLLEIMGYSAAKHNDSEWRNIIYDADYYVYFHSHDASDSVSGHFHLMKLQNDDCYHLGALEIDLLSRPVSFFLTNSWVTGELKTSSHCLWKEFNELLKGDFHQVELRWISKVLNLYKDRIDSLLRLRDETLSNESPTFNESSREISCRISLL